MKKNLWKIISLCATMCACTPQLPTSYTVEGILNDSTENGKLIYITSYDDNSLIDSTYIERNKFTFKGAIDTAIMCRINVSQNVFANFILENGNIRVNLEQEKHNYPSGTPMNNAMAKIAAEEDSLYAIIDKEGKKLRAQYGEGKDFEEKAKNFVEEWRKTLSSRCTELYKEYNNDAVGFFITYRSFLQELKPEEQLEIISNFGSWLKSRKRIQEMVTQIESIQRTSEGQPFTEIKGKNIEGKDISLSDFFNKGNYVLMDMWASWCGPCKAEVPNLALLHNEYKNKGLTVLGLFVWDNESNLKKSVKNEKITWPQIFDSEKNATKLYGVNGIPHIILFAPDGTILKRNLRGENMIKEINEIMKNK